jgi:ribosome-binding ATPase YchF (GTP1/OBG family)
LCGEQKHIIVSENRSDIEYVNDYLQVDTFTKLVSEHKKLAQEQANTARQLKEAFTEMSVLKAENLRLETEQRERSATSNDLTRAKVCRYFLLGSIMFVCQSLVR